MTYQFESSPASSSTGLNSQPPSSSSTTTSYSQPTINHPQAPINKNPIDMGNFLVSLGVAIVAGISVYFVSREEIKTSITRVETKQENFEKQIVSLETKIEKINEALHKVDRENVRLRTEYDVKNKK